MRIFVPVFLFFLLAVAPGRAEVAPPEPIRVGDMMSYATGSVFSRPYREGWQMALEDINASGGIHGRPLEIISRDDQGDPATAVRIAEELVEREKVAMLMGAGLDHVGLAVGNYANHRRIPFLKMWCGNCAKIGDPANRYWFANQPCHAVLGDLYAQEAARLPYKRWAIIAPNYEFGRSWSRSFREALQRLRPDVEFVAERYTTLNKIKAQEEIRALERAQPEAVGNLLFGPDLSQYLRVAVKLGFLDRHFHVGNYIGNPLSIRELGELYPKGWMTAGLPDDPGDHPAKAFQERFRKRYGKDADFVALEGYQLMTFVAEALRKARSTDPEKITNALKDLEIEGPLGRVVMRGKDHQAWYGFWLGRTDRVAGKGRFVDFRWIGPDRYREARTGSGEAR